jgi:hypothetical protein
MKEKEFVRHFLATIYYRGIKYLSVDDITFNAFNPKNGIRTPAEILNHINGLLLYIQSFFIKHTNTHPEQQSFIKEVKRFKSVIQMLDSTILSNDLTPQMTYEQLLQGPLADIMLHIGELSMQRKYSGNPADDIENYINADIKIGIFN